MMKTMQNRTSDGGLFPFRLVYKDTKSPQKELPDHQHNDYEIVYVYSGKGTFFIDSIFYDMEAGDIFVIPMDTIHRAMPDKLNPVTSSIIFFRAALIPDLPLGDSFSLPTLFDNVKNKKQYKLSTNGHFREIIHEHIERIHEELRERKRGYRFAAKLLLHRLILDLTRNDKNVDTIAHLPSLASYPWLDEIFSYIEENLDNDLSLSRIAGEALVSPEHFSRVFKQMTGMSFTSYIHSKRVIQAKQLLAQTSHKIAAIAQLCGFETLSHFHKMFKRHTGLTPAAFRKLDRSRQ